MSKNGPLRVGIGGPVGVDLERMAMDADKNRNGRKTIFTDLKRTDGLDAIVAFLKEEGGL